MSEPLISVIIPVYGVERYLDHCVESVAAQTHHNLEIILVDDGGKDQCPAMCDVWADKDSRTRVIHKANGGLSSARNAGLDVATGEFVAFVDSDDWIEPTMLESMLGWMRKHTTVDVVMCGTEKDYEDGRKEHIDGHLPEREFSSDEALHDFLHHRNRMASAVWNKLFKADFFTGARHIRFPEGLNNEDYYVLAQVYRTMRGILFSPKALYHYRIRPDSITTTGLNAHSFDRAKIADKCCEYLLESEYRDQRSLDYFAMQGRYDIVYDLARMNVDSEVLNTWRKELATKAKPVYRDASVGFAEKMKIRMLARLPRLYAWMTRR
ncbi:glycosyltransferase family 2 protein [Bifidobacterium dentium]|uniref:glycosyltransferase family 2 protein n=1 Tax=Bifidobacterium dentium TaxID=1689 RepID=UPI003D171230